MDVAVEKIREEHMHNWYTTHPMYVELPAVISALRYTSSLGVQGILSSTMRTSGSAALHRSDERYEWYARGRRYIFALPVHSLQAVR